MWSSNRRNAWNEKNMTRPEININWQILALSFVMAVGLWYAITVRERMEMQAEVSLTYRGIPDNLMVVDGLLKSYTVQLRGPRELVRALDTKTLSASVDLSVLRRGTNVITLSPPSVLVNSRALDVMGLSPNRLTLEVEAVMERTVPVEPRFNSPQLAQALKAENLRTIPAGVTIRGPESVVKKVNSLSLEVPIDPQSEVGEREFTRPVAAPPQVSCSPGVVQVRYSISGIRGQLDVERTPAVNVRNAQNYHVVPGKVQLRVELPETLTTNKAYLDKIRVVLDVQSVPPGGRRIIKASVELPEGARLLGITPTTLTVTNTSK